MLYSVSRYKEQNVLFRFWYQNNRQNQSSVSFVSLHNISDFGQNHIQSNIVPLSSSHLLHKSEMLLLNLAFFSNSMFIYKPVLEVLDLYSQSAISNVALGGGDHLAPLSLSEQSRANHATRTYWFPIYAELLQMR